MKYFTTALLLAAMATARVARNTNVKIHETDEPDLDIDQVVGREGYPTGLIATDDEKDQAQQFLNWSATFGASYKSAEEKELREHIWKDANRKIRENNLKAEASYDPDAAYMDHNEFSIMTYDEILKSLGDLSGQMDEQDEPASDLSDSEDDSSDDESLGRRLKGEASNVEREKAIYYDESYVGPVRAQGDCGSCYAFAATTAATGAYTRKVEILTGEKPEPQVLSPQMIVDCSKKYKEAELEGVHIDPAYARNSGCRGGMSTWSFNFMSRHGNMLEEDYPYATEEQECKYDRKKKVRNVRNYKQILPSE